MAKFTIERQVQLHETDLGGLMHHPNYFNWMESAEYELFEELGEPVVGDLTAEMKGSGWPRGEVSMKFYKPLRFRDKVEISLYVTRIRAAAVSYEAEFHRVSGKEGKELVAKGAYTALHCMYDARQLEDPQLCPADLSFLEKLEAYLV